KRPDGYHNIVSTFLKVPSGDILYISESTAGIDIVNANVNIKGENIVLKALRVAREEGFKFPFLNVMIHKSIPAGSGLGAGSGNAAAILMWLGAGKVAAKVGSDVPFLSSGLDMAVVSGIGENIEPMKSSVARPHGIIAIPEWQTDTKTAYAEIDESISGFDTLLARTEMRDMYSANAGKKVGLLPNDFLKVLLKTHSKYNELFSIFEKAGANAWGLTGSGSAVFGLFDTPKFLKWPSYIKNVLYF
ncbi:MAG: 4-diphosphocytidyl-2C-methyl-D-erythritol kinase, partial [Synergistaceae bacterium]|nr:4-diphosphocytidyl-2C-methyl-D-erythritol kinase [Synergistaceae bacterium]